jgi:membrane-bound serine protease (ClpP class)
VKKSLITAFLGLILIVCALPLALEAQEGTAVPKRKVAVIPLTGDVDWHMLATLTRRLGEAKKWGAQDYVFEIDSYGGYLQAIEDIAAVVVEQSHGGARTTAFIVNKALSGGAYIAMACDEIAMQPYANFGDVMPILPTLQELPEDINEKFRSPVRARFAEYATQHGYPVALAKAMVDPEVEVVRVVLAGPEGQDTHYLEGSNIEEWVHQKTEVEGYQEVPPRETVVAEGELLTMGATKAREYGFSKYTVATRLELLGKLAEAYYTGETGEVKSVRYGEVFDVSVFSTNWWEAFIGFLTSPIVKVILLFVGLLGLYVEFKIPGFGVPGIVGIICISLVLFASYAVGLASMIELVMIGAGLVLLALEVFVIPGFGVAGISGLILLLLGVLLSFQKGIIPETPFETEVLQENIVVLATSFIVFAVAAILLARYLPKTKQFSKIALNGPGAGTVHGDAAVQEARMSVLLGKTGVAITTLRPAGKAKIQGQLVDVVTQGEFLEKDASIRVLHIEGNRIVVVPEAGSES